jgi:hypothetical protein
VYLNAYPIDERDQKHARDVRKLFMQKSLASGVLEMPTCLPKVPKWVEEDKKQEALVSAKLQSFLEGLASTNINHQKLVAELQQVERKEDQEASNLRSAKEYLNKHDVENLEHTMFNQDIDMQPPSWWPFPAQEEQIFPTNFTVSSVSITPHAQHRFTKGNKDVKVTFRTPTKWGGGSPHYNVQIRAPYREFFAEEIRANRDNEARLEAQVQNTRKDIERTNQALRNCGIDRDKFEGRSKIAQNQLLALRETHLSLVQFRERCMVQQDPPRPPMTLEGLREQHPCDISYEIMEVWPQEHIAKHSDQLHGR